MKIKVCHFVNKITGKSDGVYTHLKMIFKYVNNDKYQHYLVFQGNPAIEEEVAKLGVKVFSLPSLNKKFSIKTFIEFYSIIKKQNIDIIHTHLIKPYSIGGIINILLKKKLIFNYNGLFIKNKYNTKFEQFLYKIIHIIISFSHAVDEAIVPSKTSRDILYSETKLFPKISVYYNGINENIDVKVDDKFSKMILNLRHKYLLVAVVARLDIQKRIDLALEIVKKVIKLNPKVYFIFAGDGVLETKMKNLAHNLLVESNVVFTGFIPNVKYYLKYFDLLLFTSDWEGFPLSIWESMASSVSIISTDVGGIKDVLLQENCGLIFPKGDVDKGADCVLELLEDENKRIKMGANGKNAVINKYTSESFASYFDNLYTDLLKRN